MGPSNSQTGASMGEKETFDARQYPDSSPNRHKSLCRLKLPGMPDPQGLLFTAFEHSGDHIAAALITELKRREPDRPIYAMGGPAMEKAGAELIETTTDKAVMLAGAVAQVSTHLQRLGRLKAWLADHPIAALIPTDSPAANWSVCSMVRKHQPHAKVVHLVAPQLWAWAPWRIRKLRRLTDHVLCLLPFEPNWFGQRGVTASFVGHPLYDQIPAGKKPPGDGLPKTPGPKLALLPGSRQSEIKHNWPTMLDAYRRLHASHHDLTAVVAASDSARAHQIELMSPLGVLPRGMHMTVGDADAVLNWADAGLIVSGTATLHAAAHGTAMAVFYNVKRYQWHLIGRWLINTRTMSLPNLIGESMDLGRVVPELMPHFGDPDVLTRAISPLLKDGGVRREQHDAFQNIRDRFSQKRFERAAADVLLEVIGEMNK
jgi:lipid-A-disaccharide synthase